SRPSVWPTRAGSVALLPFAAAAPPPLASSHAGQFAVAGIAPGMSLADAVREMHQTFAIEGLTDVHAVSVAVQQGEAGAVRRLSLQQSASTAATGLRD
ncbi:MAG: hypothetical protein POG24_05165, partial [Acidocella sp.]|nr:hypothetical protein [Acidocella sp.]